MTPPKKDALVTVTGKELTTTTLAIAEGTEHEHASVIKLVRAYQEDLEEYNSIRFEIRLTRKDGKGGRPTEYAVLTEPQTSLLMMYLRNTDVVREFKKRINREFYRMRQELIRLASQSQNAEWLECRKSGKVTRVLSTDAVKEFVAYAEERGSKNAGRYYSNISKMENQALFFLEQEFKNLRDMLNIHQLSAIQSADQIVIKALRDGMRRQMCYKDIYRLAKSRVEGFAESIGKSAIPERAMLPLDALER